jgi:beta-1,2-mannobiose phosphorylase / 1,2-beta-oligomannan phosphorylase
MNWVGPKYGTDAPAMWISTGDDMLSWKNPKLLAKAEFDWENQKIGGNTPPIKTKKGWLHIYHAVGKDRKYRLGAMLLDLKDPSIVRYRSTEPIIEPEEKYTYEFAGPYKWGICFPCGSVVIKDTLFVYYGGADKFTGVATCPLSELLEYLVSCPVKK